MASSNKHERVLANGASVAVDYTHADWSKQVLHATGGNGVDIFLDADGNLGGESLDVLARKARWIAYGIQNTALKPFPVDRQWDFIFKNVTLRGYTIDTDFDEFPEAMPELLSWVESGSVNISVTGFALADARKAHAAVEARKTTGKVVLIP
ncbi:zinc-binding dehydrogenase [Paraburkholderia caribensis]|uniref:zinc-binding dehydrogenase n=1 Tax=Paraburkholderia caribensis TaxID=75105 RepID=UPI00078B9BB1|nr:zinc-binding dehydrogenase [Paraburkholderia caribensis]AMV47807.1 hypothetical protein ATN79_44885 [Paraburkholderia caribensis]